MAHFIPTTDTASCIYFQLQWHIRIQVKNIPAVSKCNSHLSLPARFIQVPEMLRNHVDFQSEKLQNRLTYFRNLTLDEIIGPIIRHSKEIVQSHSNTYSVYNLTIKIIIFLDKNKNSLRCIVIFNRLLSVSIF